MTSPQKTSLKSLRDRYLQAEQVYADRDQLWEERSRLEAALESSKDEEETLEIRKKKIEVDHQLDIFDEGEEVELQELEKEIISAIIEAHPEQAEGHQEIQAQLERWRQLEERLVDTVTACDQVSVYLTTALEVWEGSRWVQALRFVFGPSPTVVTANNLQKVEQLCGGAVEKIEALQQLRDEHDGGTQLLEKLVTLLKVLKSECSGGWDFRRLRETYGPALKMLSGNIRQLEAQVTLCHEERKKTEQSLRQWIESSIGD